LKQQFLSKTIILIAGSSPEEPAIFKHMRFLAFLLVLFWSITALGGNRQEFLYSIMPGSTLAIAGFTNISHFVCFSSNESSLDAFQIDFGQQNNRILTFSGVELKISVFSIDCGNRLMNRDLQHSLGGRNFPYIEIQVLEATRISHNSQTGNGRARVLVDISMNGRSRKSYFMVEFNGSNPSEFSVIGSKKIKMTDFGITPPSPVMGLVKVNDEVSIQLNLIVKLQYLGQIEF